MTVALRCPDGAVKRQRFTVESQIKVMLTIHCTIHKHICFFEGIESAVTFALLVVHYIALSIFS